MNIGLTGYSSVPGPYTIDALEADGHALCLLGRTQVADTSHWQYLDLCALPDALSPPLSIEMLVHLAPLPMLVDAIPWFAAAGVRRLVAVGTTSRFTKADSPSIAERRLARQFAAAEEQLVEQCDALGIAWTLLRPTLIYDGYRDANIATIRRLAQRFGFFPVVPGRCGLRQPLHAADLAGLLARICHQPPARSGAYNIGGGETLAYDAMIARVLADLPGSPRVRRIPEVLLKVTLSVLRRWPGFRGLDPAMVVRMRQDLVFDDSDARRVLGHDPGPLRIESPLNEGDTGA